MNNNVGKRHKLKYLTYRYIQSYFRVRRLKKIGIHIRFLKLLDFGCGPGVFIGYLHENNLCEQSFGLDISKGSIEQAKMLFPNIKQFFFNKQEQIVELGSFDIITSFFTHKYLQDEKKFFKFASQMLKKSGLLVIEVNQKKSLYNFWAKNDLSGWEVEKKNASQFRLIKVCKGSVDTWIFNYERNSLLKNIVKIMVAFIFNFFLFSSQSKLYIFEKE